MDSMGWLGWALLSALFAGMTAVLAKVGVEGVNSNVATAVRTTVILGFAWLLALPGLRETPLGAVSRRTWVFLVLSGLATGLSWACYFRALQLGKASQVAPVDKLSVLLVLVFGAVFLRERLSAVEYAGAGLIASGALLMALK